MTETRQESPALEGDTRLGDLVVTFPEVRGDTPAQDAEFCLVRAGDETRRIRFHDYDEIYGIPGLYEHIFYEKLRCQSPALLSMLLQHEVRRAELEPEDLAVLDVGAGNGIMGEVLSAQGVDVLVGLDILPEAATAAQRDRPGLYDAYHAVDLLDLPRDVHRELAQQRFDCLTLIAALGFGDIPPEAFTVAFNFVEDGGFAAFNLRDRFMNTDDASGFARLIQHGLDVGAMEELITVRYVHRLAMTGEPLYYTGMIVRKHADLRLGHLGARNDN